MERELEHDVHELGTRGIRSLAVAKTTDEGRWVMLGLLTFLDPPREDTKKTLEDARTYGVAVKMITGDHLLVSTHIRLLTFCICKFQCVSVRVCVCSCQPSYLACGYSAAD